MTFTFEVILASMSLYMVVVKLEVILHGEAWELFSGLNLNPMT